MTTVLCDIIASPGLVTPQRAATPSRTPRELVARYDAAQTTAENAAHWQHADSRSPRSANSPGVRRTLRERARYEVANNSFAKGIVRTVADFRVGTGPTLNVMTEDGEYNRIVSELFAEHCVSIGFARKLWLMSVAWDQDGESIGLRVTNGGLSSRVKLDLNVVETEMLCDPAYHTGRLGTINDNDGILFDDWGNPAGYYILDQHPGDSTQFTQGKGRVYRADTVSHLFRVERAGQIRGIPAMTPGLPLLAYMRRYTLATIAAAETAANHAGVWETQGAVDNPDDLVPLDAQEIPRNSIAAGPYGWALKQLKPEQPTTNHEMFKRATITEFSRAQCVPYGIAAGDSSQYNFASGKLDNGPFFKSITIDQEHIEDVVVDPFFRDWFREASLIPGYLPDPPSSSRPGSPPRGYLWDGQEYVDPREAAAQFIALQGGFQTLPRLCAKKGLNFEVEVKESARSFGVTVDEMRRLLKDQIFTKSAVPPTAPTEDPAKEDDQ